uniref:RNA helicase n=1 Tax=Alexandrium andersonii TaxID=327968 RepID=A0A7S2BAD7_9DINO
MSGEDEAPVWGNDVWQDDEKVRTIAGEAYDPWKTWDVCCGPWKFPNGLMQFLIDAGFKCPTPIQAHTWPVLMDGKDVIGVAKTGSGKTLGYLLPGYIKVKREEMKPEFSCDHTAGPSMLVMAPTRELCQQIFEESDRFGKPAAIKTACVFGGAPRQPQVRSLHSGPHCVVATPGRLNDFLKDGSCKIGRCVYLVLDEADRMLDMGFEPQVKELVRFLPPQRQTALFTATWPREVKQVAETLTQTPTHIQVGSSDAQTTNADIRQHVVKIRSESDKMRHLEEEIFPLLQKSGCSALIFTKTKRAAASMHSTLARAGAPIVPLHGDMDQRDRDHSLWAFKQGKAKVLVATDVAQRGLDIKNVHIVVNYDPPANVEDYVHRIGRTGRAGVKGDAFTYLYDNETGIAMNIMKVMKKSGQEVPAELKEIAHGGGNLTGQWGGRFASSGGGGAEPDGQWGGRYSQGGGGGDKW